MKKYIIVLFLLAIILLSLGCSQDQTISDQAPIENSDNIEITYNIEQIYFLKSFQCLSPNIELIDNNGDKKIVASLGLSDYSEISIDDIKLEDGEVNIYISGSREGSESSLSVPQIILDFDNEKSLDLENLKFNLIHNNYDYINIKFNINDVLNKLKSNFKLALNSSPSFNLIKEDGRYIWDIEFKNIISRESSNYPLIDLKAQVDANTGELIDHKKIDLTKTIDMGNILNYQDQGGFVYKKSSDLQDDLSKTELWYYNTLDGKKKMIFTSENTICCPKISKDLENVAFIEKTDGFANVYIYSNKDSKSFKLNFENSFKPQSLEWRDNNKLYLLESQENASLIYSYDLNSNNIEIVSRTNKLIDSIVGSEYGFIVSESKDKGDNKLLYFTEDFKNFKTIDLGFEASFLNEKTIIFLVNDEEFDVDHLMVYDLEEERIISKLEKDVIKYSIISDNNLLYVANNPKYKDFTLSKYYLDLNTSLDIVNIVDPKVYYNSGKNLIYLNLNLPFEDSHIIYTINLK